MSAIGYCTVFAGMTAWLTIGPSLRKMEAPAAAPSDAVVQTSSRSPLLLVAFLSALLGLAGAILPGVLFRLGLLGLLTGVLWLGAAVVVRYREVRWFHSQLVVGKRTSWFKPGTESFYLIPTP